MPPAGLKAALLVAVLVAGSGLLAGCASTSDTAAESDRVEYDPFEPVNRKIHKFNTAMDKFALKPIARGYEKVVPKPIRKGFTNFFSNLTTPRSALNNFLQGEPKQGFNELGRFLINSTFGIGGLFDFAKNQGMERYDENFAQTLSVWGVPDGPYVVIPFWGPNMMSDVFALPVDYYSDVWTYYDNTSVRDKVWLLRLIDLRYRLLSLEEFLEDSTDPYITIRESFMGNRNFRIYDGDEPDDEDVDDDGMHDDFFENGD
jgi:phospholipid-binding lipoprotein MlaA